METSQHILNVFKRFGNHFFIATRQLYIAAFLFIFIMIKVVLIIKGFSHCDDRFLDSVSNSFDNKIAYAGNKKFEIRKEKL